jgi:hypothetical protein
VAIWVLENAERRLDHAPHVEPLRRPERVEQRRAHPHPVGALDLGQQHRVDRQCRRRGEVGVSPRGVEGIDAQHQLAPAIAAGGERCRDNRPGFLLRLRRHCIFEIDDQPVRGQRARFLQGSRVRAGHEEKAAVRAKDGGHDPCPFTMLLYQ